MRVSKTVTDIIFMPLLDKCIATVGSNTGIKLKKSYNTMMKI